MFGVDLYGRVRLAVLSQGLSQREASRRFGIDSGTVAKMVSHSAPPGYRRSVEPRRPKLDRHSGFIDHVLSDDLNAPRKQRHTIQRIYDRLRDERGFVPEFSPVFFPCENSCDNPDFLEKLLASGTVGWRNHFDLPPITTFSIKMAGSRPR